MKLRFLGQSGYLLESGDTRLLIDPYLSDSVNRVAGRPRMLPIPWIPDLCDAVICTHDHLDHLDPDTVMKQPVHQRYITTSGGQQTLHRLGRKNVTVLAVGEYTSVGAFEIEAVFADHSVEAFGLLIRAEGYCLYFSGDTLYDRRLFAVADSCPDVVFLCINGRLGNMNAAEAVAVAKAIGAPVSIPNHYDMFASNSEDPRNFTDFVPGSRVLTFNKEYDLSEIVCQEAQQCLNAERF